jgi:hypothetical protein
MDAVLVFLALEMLPERSLQSQFQSGLGFYNADFQEVRPLLTGRPCLDLTGSVSLAFANSQARQIRVHALSLIAATFTLSPAT